MGAGWGGPTSVLLCSGQIFRGTTFPHHSPPHLITVWSLPCDHCSVYFLLHANRCLYSSWLCLLSCVSITRTPGHQIPGAGTSVPWSRPCPGHTELWGGHQPTMVKCDALCWLQTPPFTWVKPERGGRLLLQFASSWCLDVPPLFLHLPPPPSITWEGQRDSHQEAAAVQWILKTLIPSASDSSPPHHWCLNHSKPVRTIIYMVYM